MADFCAWCGDPLPPRKPGERRRKFCPPSEEDPAGQQCRQFAWRAGKRTEAAGYDKPGLFIYADPPYPGLSAKYYRNEPSFAGEVDHRALVASLSAAADAKPGELSPLVRGRPVMGWALSTSSKALRDVLPLCPPDVRVGSWVKPLGVPAATYGPHSRWEPLITWGGRRLQPGIPDWLRAMPARGGGSLTGRKPIAFCGWLFDMLGMLPGDELIDLFPGTGVVARAWAWLSSRSSATGQLSLIAGRGRLPKRTPLLSLLQSSDSPGLDDAGVDAESSSRPAQTTGGA